MKAIIENDKKPYHCLDYLFLATDREKHFQQNASLDLKEDNGDESSQFSYPRPDEHSQKRYPDLSPTRSPLTHGSPAMSREIFRQENIDLDYMDDSFDEVVGVKTPCSAAAVAYEGSDSPFDENAADYASNLFE